MKTMSLVHDLHDKREPCNICGKQMDTGAVPDENCGGDCCECMARVGGDPDCIKSLIRYYLNML